jgi:biotin carboxylase
MREKLAETKGGAFWFEGFDLEEDVQSIVTRVPFPCVVKPVSLSGSRGVTRCNTQEEFLIAWDRLKRLLGSNNLSQDAELFSTEILVETYLSGREVAVEGIMVQGSMTLVGILDKPDLMDGPFFEETILITPSSLTLGLQERLVAKTEEIATSLGLLNGPVHAEFRIEKEAINLLEIAPRSIGGYCSKIFKFHPEATLEELILRQSLGMKISHFEKENKSEGVFMLPVPKAGILKNVGRIEEALQVDGIEDIEITIPVGRRVVPLPEGNQYLGFMFAKGKDPSSVESSLREAFSILELEIQQ